MAVVIDVDDTLIEDIFNHKINDMTMEFNYYGQLALSSPIHSHIDLLKSYRARGYEITVWSANGWQWAKEVVEKLKLTEYVDIVATKPVKYVDDKPADSWMSRVYLK